MGTINYSIKPTRNQNWGTFQDLPGVSALAYGADPLQAVMDVYGRMHLVYTAPDPTNGNANTVWYTIYSGGSWSSRVKIDVCYYPRAATIHFFEGDVVVTFVNETTNFREYELYVWRASTATFNKYTPTDVFPDSISDGNTPGCNPFGMSRAGKIFWGVNTFAGVTIFESRDMGATWSYKIFDLDSNYTNYFAFQVSFQKNYQGDLYVGIGHYAQAFDRLRIDFFKNENWKTAATPDFVIEDFENEDNHDYFSWQIDKQGNHYVTAYNNQNDSVVYREIIDEDFESYTTGALPSTWQTDFQKTEYLGAINAKYLDPIDTPQNAPDYYYRSYMSKESIKGASINRQINAGVQTIGVSKGLVFNGVFGPGSWYNDGAGQMAWKIVTMDNPNLENDGTLYNTFDIQLWAAGEYDWQYLGEGVSGIETEPPTIYTGPGGLVEGTSEGNLEPDIIGTTIIETDDTLIDVDPVYGDLYHLGRFSQYFNPVTGYTPYLENNQALFIGQPAANWTDINGYFICRADTIQRRDSSGSLITGGRLFIYKKAGSQNRLVKVEDTSCAGGDLTKITARFERSATQIQITVKVESENGNTTDYYYDNSPLFAQNATGVRIGIFGSAAINLNVNPAGHFTTEPVTVPSWPETTSDYFGIDRIVVRDIASIQNLTLDTYFGGEGGFSKTGAIGLEPISTARSDYWNGMGNKLNGNIMNVGIMNGDANTPFGHFEYRHPDTVSLDIFGTHAGEVPRLEIGVFNNEIQKPGGVSGVENFRVEVEGTHATLSFDEKDGADHYILYINDYKGFTRRSAPISETSLILKDLPSGYYDFFVTWVDGSGVESSPSNLQSAGIGTALPFGPPQILVGEVVQEAAQLSLGYIVTGNGAPISSIDYQLVKVSDGSIVQPWTTLNEAIGQVTAGSLAAGQQYRFDVRATNTNGTTTESATGVYATAPGEPVINSAIGEDGEITVVFNPPASNGGNEILRYEYRVGTATAQQAGAFSGSNFTNAEFTITGLSEGQTYDIQMRAVNGIGEGAWSAVTQVPIPVSPISFHDASTLFVGTTTSTTINVPAGIQAGDLIMIHVMHRGTLTTPAGYTLLGTTNPTGMQADQRSSVLYRTATGSESGASVTIQQSVSNRLNAQIQVFRATGTLSIQQWASDAEPNTGFSLPALTATDKDDFAVIQQAFVWSGTSAVITGVSGYTPTTPLTGDNIRLYCAYKQMKNAETISGAASINNSNDDICGFSIILRST